MRKPVKSKLRAAKPAPAPPADEYIRFACPCGAALKIPEWRLDGHGVCPKCKRRLLLSGKETRKGGAQVSPLVLEGDRSGQTFMIEPQYRIEDHFKEIPDAQDKIAFHCPCGFKLHARLSMVDKRGKCPDCGARLLLVGKKNARSGMMEIHPLVVDEAPSGDTRLVDL